jgi:hypothetical protein
VRKVLDSRGQGLTYLTLIAFAIYGIHIRLCQSYLWSTKLLVQRIPEGSANVAVVVVMVAFVPVLTLLARSV